MKKIDWYEAAEAPRSPEEQQRSRMRRRRRWVVAGLLLIALSPALHSWFEHSAERYGRWWVKECQAVEWFGGDDRPPSCFWHGGPRVRP